MNVQSAVTFGVTAPTAAQVLALLADSDLEPEILTLPTFAADHVPGAGEIGLNQAGELAVGDDETVQGVRFGPRQIKGHVTLSVSGLAKSGAPKRVVAIPLLASEMIPGAVIKITARNTYRNKDIGAISQLLTGLAWDAASSQLANGAIGWQSVDCHPLPGTDTVIAWDNATLMVNGALTGTTSLALDTDTSSSAFSYQSVYADGTDPVTTSPAISFEIHGDEATPAGVDTNLWLMYQVGNTGGGNFGAVGFLVAYDIIVEVTLP